MLRKILAIVLILIPGLFITTVFGQTSLTRDSTISALDGVTQVFYYQKSQKSRAQPLVVQLHSWSYNADSLKTVGLDKESEALGFNYIFPNFRGINNQPKACCSEFVIDDIDAAIDWALENMEVDKKRIYVVGYSGGGFATLAMFMKSRHKIKAFSAWVPISDLVAWHAESFARKNKYANEIIRCTGSTDGLDEAKAQARSPYFWKTPTAERKKSKLQIFAGIHDGYTGPVPISQSIKFYNKLLTDYKVKDKSKYVSAEAMEEMLTTQSFPHKGDQKIGNNEVIYQNAAKNLMITIFEGGHDILSKEALEYIINK